MAEGTPKTFKEFARDNVLMRLIDKNNDTGLTQVESLKLLLKQTTEHEGEAFSKNVEAIARVIAPLIEKQAGQPVQVGYIMANARELVEDYARFTGDKELAAKVQAARQSLAPEAAGSTPSNVLEIETGRQN